MRARCVQCHPAEEGGKLSRISYLRKTPEGWELSVKRMARIHKAALTPDDARAIVRYLADRHGLARGEAETAQHEVERRVHWSEEKADKDLRDTCAECHTLGRVLSERRDAEEWKLLKATHLAFFPLARWQAFRGEDAGEADFDWSFLTEEEAEARWEERQRNPPRDRADRVLEKLAADLPLWSAEWEAWQASARSVPLEGTWSVVAHEPGRGDVHGTLTLRRTGVDAYETAWDLVDATGKLRRRTGKGLLYAGCSWRGRSQTPEPGEPAELREVLLLSEDWNTLRGRVFSGEYGEIGADVRLVRRRGLTAIHDSSGALLVPGDGQALEVIGEAFPETVAAAELSLGEGVSVRAVERVSAERLRLTVDVAAGARAGARLVSLGAVRGPADVVLHDTVDYVKITPGKGLARVGGVLRPPQLERFEAVAMHRGADGKPYTADDFAVDVVPARWSLEEFPVRESDDDVRFVGAIDAASGTFTPGRDGPNPERRWSANNIGEVYVVATCTLRVRPRPPAPPPDPKRAPGAAPAPEPELLPPADVEFRARAPLLVMVPIYVDWARYAWEHR